jgi:hypothetical protein
MGAIRCPEMSVKDHDSMLRNTAEERSSQNCRWLFPLHCIIGMLIRYCKYLHQNSLHNTLCQILFGIFLYMCILRAER